MKNCSAIIIQLYLIASLVNCMPRKRKSGTIQKIRQTGQVVADDGLIRKYENEHQKLYRENTKDGDHLEWPALDKKDLSNYCRKYLQQSVSYKITNNVIGIAIKERLHYEKENSSISNIIIIVHCKVKNSHTLSYYMTRALEPNCVYALRCTDVNQKFIYTIIHKHCDFEAKNIRNKPLKHGGMEIIYRLQRETGQPIAKDEYLLTYELEHQKFFRIEGVRDKGIEWPYVMVHYNLDSYCYQYLRKCVPRRNQINVIGRLKIVKLRYQKLNTNKFICVTTVQCLTHTMDRQRYYMTRSPEVNCVYALLRQGFSENSPLVIIFKHCDFENQNEQQLIGKAFHDISNKKINPKTEAKEKTSDTMELLQLFPYN